MRRLFLLLPGILPLLCACILGACSKSSNPSTPDYTGNWRLASVTWSIGIAGGIRIPATDSAVVLSLMANDAYSASLNNRPVCQGGYTIKPNGNDSKQRVLQLGGFTTTGILASSRLIECSPDGILYAVDGFFMSIQGDSLVLSSLLTPGGNTIYKFSRQ